MSIERSDAAIESAANAKLEKNPANIGQVAQLTIGQLEREVSQKIQALYKKVLGHHLGRVSCQLSDSKVAITLEDSISKPVKLLVEASQIELAQQVHSDLNDAMQPKIKALLADVLGVEALDILSDATLNTSKTGMIGVLACRPAVRNPEAVSKAKNIPF